MKRLLVISTLALTFVIAGPAQAKTFVACANGGNPFDLRYKIKPSACNFTYPAYPDALSGAAAKLHWKNWGGRVAKARGIGRVGPATGEVGPVRIRLSRRQKCGRHYFYTTVMIASDNKAAHWTRIVCE
jgi:hypothetical protein